MPACREKWASTSRRPQKADRTQSRCLVVSGARLCIDMPNPIEQYAVELPSSVSPIDSLVPKDEGSHLYR